MSPVGLSMGLVSGSMIRSPSETGAGDENGAVGCGIATGLAGSSDNTGFVVSGATGAGAGAVLNVGSSGAGAGATAGAAGKASGIGAGAGAGASGAGA
jgi:hypothetical protein